VVQRGTGENLCLFFLFAYPVSCHLRLAERSEPPAWEPGDKDKVAGVE